MTLKLDAGTRTRILVDFTLDFDPAGSTPEYRVDATWYPAAWLASESAVHIEETTTRRARWTQTARTNGYFAGPDAVAAGAVVLALGRHETETRVTSGADIITQNSASIEVIP